jgi:hypothetical protein
MPRNAGKAPSGAWKTLTARRFANIETGSFKSLTQPQPFSPSAAAAMGEGELLLGRQVQGRLNGATIVGGCRKTMPCRSKIGNAMPPLNR